MSSKKTINKEPILFSNLSKLDKDNSDHLKELYGYFFFIEESDYKKLSPSELFKQLKNENPGGHRILTILKKYFKTAIVENDYFDTESADCHSKLYARSFRSYDKRCKRIHFFSDKLDIKKFLTDSEEEVRDNYLGYVVIRPVKSKAPTTIGKTFIKPPDTSSDDYYLCGGKTEVNLSGIPLNIVSCPFIQQDQLVSACATASLWIMTQALSIKFGGPTPTTTRLTELATTRRLQGGRPFPSAGLNLEQISWCLLNLGYSPVTFEIGDKIKKATVAKRVIYTYIESNIPVMLGVEIDGGKHAITVIGHGYEINTRPLKILKRDMSYHPNCEWVPYFIIQDDQRGPYRYLKFDFKKKNSFPSPILMSNTSDFKDACAGRLYAIVIPHPSESIYTIGNDAETKAASIIKLGETAFGKLITLPDDIILRTYLTSSNEYKNNLKLRNGMGPLLVALFKGKTMPKYIWITEFSKVAWKNDLSKRYDKIFGEVLIDPTSCRNEIDFICMNIQGVYSEMSPLEKDPKEALSKYVIVPSKGPYSSWGRSLK